MASREKKEYFYLGDNVVHLFVLGAGASVEYGLPLWGELGNLIEDHLSQSTKNNIKHKKEILEWLSFVGEKKKYRTIDECIHMESRAEPYHEIGLDVENCIFSIIKEIFSLRYKNTKNGWITALNDILLKEYGTGLRSRIAFINYNYDNVLDLNLLNFSHLSQKDAMTTYYDELRGIANSSFRTLFPHGRFVSEKELGHTYLEHKFSTIKDNGDDYVKAVSCYESKKFVVERLHQLGNPFKLYILGLGNGLSVNLDNIEIRPGVSEIHVTVYDPKLRDDVVDYLTKRFNLPKTNIWVYDSCSNLIKECFISTV